MERNQIGGFVFVRTDPDPTETISSSILTDLLLLYLSTCHIPSHCIFMHMTSVQSASSLTDTSFIYLAATVHSISSPPSPVEAQPSERKRVYHPLTEAILQRDRHDRWALIESTSADLCSARICVYVPFTPSLVLESAYLKDNMNVAHFCYSVLWIIRVRLSDNRELLLRGKYWRHCCLALFSFVDSAA